MPDGMCSESDCDSPAKRRGLCDRHYMSRRRRGTLPPLRPKPLTCICEGCDNPAEARGWCRKHYRCWYKHGDPLWEPYPERVRRFWEKVNKSGPVPAYKPELGPCWMWARTLNEGGYGQASWDEGGHHYQLAHRIAYFLTTGSIPEDLQLDHLCRNPPCVNPAHLEPVTDAENKRRSRVARGLHLRRVPPGRCNKGHLLDEETLWINQRGLWVCRICKRANERRNYHLRRTRQRLPSVGGTKLRGFTS